jgi:hypothetical protein
VAELNGQEVKLAKVQGTFPWHHHDDAEEMPVGVLNTGNVIDEKFTAPWAREFEKPGSHRLASAAVPALLADRGECA